MIAIQTVVICKQINNTTGGVGDLLTASIYEIYPKDGKFPLSGNLHLYILLRKEKIDLSLPFEIHMNLTNTDRQPISNNNEITISSTFPRGFMFWGIFLPWQFTLPKPGHYILKLTNQEGTLYNYHFLCTTPQ